MYGREWWISSSRSRNPIITLLKSSLPNPAGLVDCQDDDSYLWKADHQAPSNKFSAAKAWLALNPQDPIIPWHKSVWFKNHIPKHAFMTWVVAWNRLHTRDMLRRWIINVPSSCILCNSRDESRDHLFFDCVFSTRIWRHFTVKANLNPPTQFLYCLLWLQSSSRDKNLAYITNLIFQASIYAIWRERNARIHSAISRPSSSIIKDIKLIIRARLDPIDRARRSIPPAVSLLFTWFRFFQPGDP